MSHVSDHRDAAREIEKYDVNLPPIVLGWFLVRQACTLAHHVPKDLQVRSCGRSPLLRTTKDEALWTPRTSAPWPRDLDSGRGLGGPGIAGSSGARKTERHLDERPS